MDMQNFTYEKPEWMQYLKIHSVKRPRLHAHALGGSNVDQGVDPFIVT